MLVLTLMAMADFCLIVHLRRRRRNYVSRNRMARSLQLHLTRELSHEAALGHRRRLVQRAG